MLSGALVPIVCVFAVIAAVYKNVLLLSTLLRNCQQMAQTLRDSHFLLKVTAGFRAAFALSLCHLTSSEKTDVNGRW